VLSRGRCSSPVLRRHLGVFTSSGPPFYERPTSTVNRARKAPRLGFPALQHIRNPGAFSSHPFRGRVRRVLPCPPEVTLQGLATLLTCSTPSPLEAFFSLQRSWASPFRAFLLPGDRGGVSSPLSAPALCHKTPSALHRRFSGLLPPGKPSPFVPPGGLTRVGGSCSRGLYDLSGAPAADPLRKSSTPPEIPFRPWNPAPLQEPNSRAIGFLCQRPGFLPPKRAPARMAFSTDCRLQPLEEMSRLRTIFSSRGSRTPHGLRGAPLGNRPPPA